MDLFSWIADLISGFGITKVNTMCNWVAYQDEEPDSLKRYRKF